MLQGKAQVGKDVSRLRGSLPTAAELTAAVGTARVDTRLVNRLLALRVRVGLGFALTLTLNPEPDPDPSPNPNPNPSPNPTPSPCP